MRAFLLAMVVMGGVAVGAWYGLNSEYADFSSAERTAGEAVRLD